MRRNVACWDLKLRKYPYGQIGLNSAEILHFCGNPDFFSGLATLAQYITNSYFPERTYAFAAAEHMRQVAIRLRQRQARSVSEASAAASQLADET